MKKVMLLTCAFVLVLLQVLQVKPASVPKINIPRNARYVCYVDFGKLSCSDRLYIYDVNKNRIIYTARVQHGNGGKSTAITPEFSNAVGSNCSSLGLYKITAVDKMRSNQHIDCLRLRGLDSTNSNAEKRGILVHPGFTLSIIPKFPGLVIPLNSESKGCFTVSIVAMKIIEQCFKKGDTYIYAYK